MSTLRYVVETEKMAHNIQLLQQRVGSGRLYAVLKADGYGLGCQRMAALCGQYGIRAFAVTALEDAEAVVASGVEVEELLLLSSAVPGEIPRLAELGVTFTVASQLDAENLAGLQVRAHIKVDTGMGRRGFYFDQPEAIAAIYAQYPNIRFTGIYTHFADGVNRDSAQTQFARFDVVIQSLSDRGLQVGVRHCCSSTSVFLYDHMVLDGARVGSALLGRVLGGERFGLQHTGKCVAAVESVRVLPKGATVSYGRTFRADREMTIAVCPVGTHHGFGLSLQSGKQNFWPELMENLRRIRNRMTGRGVPSAIIGGKKCNVLGCVCSEMVVLDVTDVPCKPGDCVVFNINPMFLNDMVVDFV